MVGGVIWLNGSQSIEEDDFTITFNCGGTVYAGSSSSTFKVKSKTAFYATIGKKNKIQYYIKKITAKNGNKEISSNVHVKATGLGTSLEENSEFSTIIVELTDEPYYSVTPAEGLAIVNTDGFVVDGTTYFHPDASITIAPTSAVQVITATNGTENTATIASDKRSFSFAMPSQAITPSATLAEAHVVALSGNVSISEPLFTYDGDSYYKSGDKITITAKTNEIIDGITGIADYTIAADKKSATFTMPTSDLTLAVATSEVHTMSVPSGMTLSDPYTTIAGVKYYKTGVTYTFTAPEYNIIEKFTATGAKSSSISSDKRSAMVTIGSANIAPTASLTEVHTMSVPSGMTLSAPYTTIAGVKYYKTGVTYTFTAPEYNIIEKFTATGAKSSSISSNKRSATVTIGNADIAPTASLTEVHTMSVPDGMTLSDPYTTIAGVKYYKTGETYTFTAPDYNIIEVFTAKDAQSSSISSDKRSATVTIGSDNVTSTAVSLTRVHTMSVPDGMTLSDPYTSIAGVKYYKTGVTYTFTAPSNNIIDSFTAKGAQSSSVSADKRSATVTIGNADIAPTASLTEVHTMSVPDGMTLSDPYTTIAGVKYYKTGETYTFTAPDYNIIEVFTAKDAKSSSISSDKRSATVTVGAADIVPTASLTEVHTMSVPSGMTLSDPYTTIADVKYYKTGETYTFTAPDYNIIEVFTAKDAKSSSISADKRSATVTVGIADITTTASLTEVHTMSIPDNLTISKEYTTIGETKYYKTGDTYTLTVANAEHMIDVISGVESQIAADKRSAAFTMPSEDATISATTFEVHTMSVPDGMTLSDPYTSIAGVKYYKTGETYTFTAPDYNIIEGFTAKDAKSSSISADKRSATVTVGNADIAPTASLTEVHSVTQQNGITLSDAYINILGTDYYKYGQKVTFYFFGSGSVVYFVNGERIEGNSITVDHEDLTVQIGIPYIDENGNEQIRKPGEYTVLTENTNVGNLSGGWYVVEGEVSYTNTVKFNSSAYLILADGAKIEVVTDGNSEDGIYAYNNLTIYGQSNQSGILLDSAKGSSSRGIYSSTGNVTISGGSVTVTSESSGIESNKDVTIRGGSVTVSSESSGIYGYKDVTIRGGSVTATSKSGYGIESDKDVTIRGGTVTATGEWDGICSSIGNVTIRGGSVTATSKIGYGIESNKDVTISGGNVTATGLFYGIYAYKGNITLSWTNSTDSIKASRYKLNCDTSHVIIAEGKTFKDEKGNEYSGTLSSSQIAAIKGKTLTPYIVWKNVGDYAAVQIFEDASGNKRAEIDGDYTGNEPVSVTAAIEVDEIDYERELTPLTPATTVLPFSLPEGTSLNAKFYYVKEVEQVGCSWNAVMKYIGAANLPQANTPYAVILNKGEEKLKFDLHGKKATVQTAAITDQYDASGKWIFKGVYSFKVWESGDPEIGLAYAFSGSSDGAVPKGHFGRITIGSKASPMRSYLRKVSSDVRLNCSTQAAPAAARAWGAASYTANFSNANFSNSSAEVINVKFVEDDEDGKEKTTAIGRLNTATGEIKIDRWYDLKGRKVNNVNRAAKGAYYRR